MSQNRRQRVGKWGEAAAAKYLEARGYQVIARNVRTTYGEIDLAARDETGAWVFVEVKTRTNSRYGYPEEAVDGRKLDHLIKSAEAFMAGQPEEPGQSWRIDVIAVQGGPEDTMEHVWIEHFENIAA